MATVEADIITGYTPAQCSWTTEGNNNGFIAEYIGTCGVAPTAVPDLPTTCKGEDPPDPLPVDVKQSSTTHTGLAKRALDGDANPSWGGGSCTHTANELGWWSVELPEPVQIDRVDITNREDCCHDRLNGIEVLVDGAVCAGPETGWNPGETRFIACGKTGTELKIQSTTKAPLTLCEVAVYSNGVQVPLFVKPVEPPPGQLDTRGATAAQSSTSHVGDAARAIDGSAIASWGGGSCTHTANEENPWWSMTLPLRSTINRIGVTNREDCCSDRLNGIEIEVDGVKCAGPETGFQPGETRYIACAASGTEVKILNRQPGNHIITLCEVTVFGGEECAAGSAVVAGECTACAAGTYAPIVNSFSCLPAPAGEFVAEGGAVEAVACAAGEFSAAPGATACEPCAKDTYSTLMGATQCSPCPLGTTAEPGATTCTIVPETTTTTTSTSTTATTTTQTTTTTTAITTVAVPPPSTAMSTHDKELESNAAIADATAAAKANGSRMGWHMTWTPKTDFEGEQFIARICSGASKVCRRYVHILHECYPECEDTLHAARALRGPEPDYQEVGTAGVDAHKAERAATQLAWEHCLTDCAVRPSCPKMCGTDTEGCLPKCYENYKPMVASLEKIYERVKDLQDA